MIIVIVLCWSQLRYLQILNLTWYRTNFPGLAKLFSDTLLRSTIIVLVSCFYDCHFNSPLAWLSQHNSSSNSTRDGLCFCASWLADRHQGMYCSCLKTQLVLVSINRTVALDISITRHAQHELLILPGFHSLIVSPRLAIIAFSIWVEHFNDRAAILQSRNSDAKSLWSEMITSNIPLGW